MKNSFKTGALALVIAVSFVACNGTKKPGEGDTTKADTAKVDTAKKDTAKADTAKKDTVKKDTAKKK